jgi:hypothetical protein
VQTKYLLTQLKTINMKHFSLIATREYLNKIGNKSFILMTLLLPIFLSGITFLLSFLIIFQTNYNNFLLFLPSQIYFFIILF